MSKNRQTELADLLTKVYQGNVDAVTFCLHLNLMSQVIDDLIDDDKPVSDKSIIMAFNLALFELQENPFYKAHSATLLPIMQSSLMAWFDSARMEQEYLTELNAYELAKEEFVPQENEDGSFTEFVGTEPTEPVKPTFRTAQEILESVPSYTKHLKAKGVEFKGVNVSLNETNQNGIFVVKGNCSDALTLGMDPFPVNFHAETINGVETVIVENIDEFVQFQLAFMTARQSFFAE